MEFFMNNNYFFSHDFNAHVDLKMVEIRMKYGWEGYGIFWALCEIIASNDKPIQESQIKGLAFNFHLDKEYLAEFIGFCVEIELFVDRDGSITSLSLERRLEHKREKSRKAKESAKKRWESKSSTNEMQTECESNANAEQMQSDSNANKTKQNKTKPKQEISTKVDIESAKPSNPSKNERKKFFKGLVGKVEEQKQFLKDEMYKFNDSNPNKYEKDFMNYFYESMTAVDEFGITKFEDTISKNWTFGLANRLQNWYKNWKPQNNGSDSNKCYAEKEFDFKRQKLRDTQAWIQEIKERNNLNFYQGEQVGKIS
jgi:hypothetical protein